MFLKCVLKYQNYEIFSLSKWNQAWELLIDFKEIKIPISKYIYKRIIMSIKINFIYYTSFSFELFVVEIYFYFQKYKTFKEKFKQHFYISSIWRNEITIKNIQKKKYLFSNFKTNKDQKTNIITAFYLHYIDLKW